MEIHDPAGDTAVSSKRRKRRRGKKKATSQIVDQMDVNPEASKIRGDCEIANNSLVEGNVSAKRKGKRKKVKSKAGNDDEVKSRDQLNSMSYLQLSDKNLRQEIDDKLAKNEGVQHTYQDMIDITEGNTNQRMGQSHSMSKLQPSDSNLRQEIHDNLTENVDVQHTDQKKMDIESTYKLAEGNMSIKRKKRRKKAKSEDKSKDKVQSMDPANGISNLQLSENNTDQAIDGSVRLEGKVFPCESQQKPAHNQIPMEDVKFQNVLNEVNNGLFVVEGITSLDPLGVKEAESLSKDLDEYPSRPPTTTDRRKLLVLDVNGLLAYIVMPPPKGCKADINILRRAVFKRPFCDDFLKFCFQNFDVGIWSSRAKEVIDRIVDYLLGNLKPKLLFCWNMLQSTQSGFKTLENIHKPLVCKELRKIWENDGCQYSWKKGRYNESNTLLIDDSPYKALLNPSHTAIFPHPYHYEDKDDNSLGPGGDLRVYLEGLLKSENVQEYVEHHPFGQNAINETNVSWQFYSGVLQKFSDDTHARNNPNPVVTSSQNLTSPLRDKVLDLEHTTIAHSTATPIDPEVHPIHSSLVVSASQ